MKSQSCMKPTDGAWWAARRIRASTSSGSGLGRNWPRNVTAREDASVAALLAPWIQEGSPHEEVSGDRDVFGDGSVTMLSMPGHTPGSYALLVRLTRAAPVLLSGDVVHFEEQLANNYVPPFNTDRAETLASMDRLRTISTTLKATLVVQHDAGDISKLPPFPAAAE